MQEIKLFNIINLANFLLMDLSSVSIDKIVYMTISIKIIHLRVFGTVWGINSNNQNIDM